MKVCPNLKSEQSFQSDPCPAFLEVDYKVATQLAQNVFSTLTDRRK